MGKKINSNFNETSGKAVFKDTALNSFSVRLNFSPDLTYVMPAQIVFGHKPTTPLIIDGRTIDVVNSVVMVGIDKQGVALDVKVVPVSNLSRFFFENVDVEAEKKDGKVRGKDKMKSASMISEIVSKYEETGRRTNYPVAYKVTKKTVYVPKFKETTKGSFDFVTREGDSKYLDLEEKIVSIFNDTDMPAVNYSEAIPVALQEYILG
jgi:hypothetical protein